MLLLLYVTKARVGRVLRFNTFDELLLFVNDMYLKSAGYPYLVLENGQIKVTYEYFATVYKKWATKLNKAISQYLTGKGTEREKYYVRH
jgi:hypothetical protein